MSSVLFFDKLNSNIQHFLAIEIKIEVEIEIEIEMEIEIEIKIEIEIEIEIDLEMLIKDWKEHLTILLSSL